MQRKMRTFWMFKSSQEVIFSGQWCEFTPLPTPMLFIDLKYVRTKNINTENPSAGSHPKSHPRKRGG